MARAECRRPNIGLFLPRFWADSFVRAVRHYLLSEFTDQFFFWDDNLYNAAGSFKALMRSSPTHAARRLSWSAWA